MSTLSARSVPVFSYVGRLKDSRKGFELFLDALAILWEGNSSALFKIWIIGGDEQDNTWAMALASCRPPLKRKLLSGDLIFWGHVENSALPEFYSRSTALVVPSLREQFGIVAIEAMTCGCPVIAARIGGLQDVIVDHQTGNLFDRGMATSLVGIMNAYLSSPALPRWLGRNAAAWASRTFDAEVVFSALNDALRNEESRSLHKWDASQIAQYNSLLISEVIPTLGSMLQSKVIDYRDTTSSHATSFMIKTESAQKYFVKLYTQCPASLSWLHHLPFPGDPALIPKERLALALRLTGQDFFPAILAHNPEGGIIVQEWIEPDGPTPFDEAWKASMAAAQYLQTYDPAPETQPIRAKIYQRLAEFQDVGCDQLLEIDCLSAEVHAPLAGGSMRTRRVHPQLELFRIHRFLSLNSYWIPRDYTARAQAAILFLLAFRPLIPAVPKFAHGSFKMEHLLSTKPILCDFDHAGYFCGPVDIAHFVWHFNTSVSSSHPGHMFRQLRKELSEDTELDLGIFWVLALQLNRDLVSFSRGDHSVVPVTVKFLYEFTEALRDAQSIR